MSRRTCAHPACDRPAPGHPPDQLCTRHDGSEHVDVCLCPTAFAGSDGQCVVCWHPIVSLHAGLISALRVWPDIAQQFVSFDTRGRVA